MWPRGDSLGRLSDISGSLVVPGGHFGAIMASQMGTLGRQGYKIESKSELCLIIFEFFCSISNEKSNKRVTKYGIPFWGHVFQKYFFFENFDALVQGDSRFYSVNTIVFIVYDRCSPGYATTYSGHTFLYFPEKAFHL